jgi:hypothetical protein
MGKRIALSILVVGMLVLGLVGACLAGIEPSPFQPEINQLHSIELNIAAINKRMAKMDESETLPNGATNYLNAMATKMQGLKARLEEVLIVLPTPSLINPYIGQDEVLFALDSIRGDSKGAYGIVEHIVSRMGIGPSPFLPLFNDVSRTIIIQVNRLLVPLQLPEFPEIEPPPIFQLP